MSARDEGAYVTRLQGLITGDLLSRCSVCGRQKRSPDKGLGRAAAAAWESRHGENCTSPKAEAVSA